MARVRLLILCPLLMSVVSNIWSFDSLTPIFVSKSNDGKSILVCQVGFVKGERCFRDICIEDNYTLQFDPANQDSDAYRYIWAGFYLSDVKEVDTDHQHVTIDLGLMLTWRDTRVYCRNQVVKVLDILNTNMLLIWASPKSKQKWSIRDAVRKNDIIWEFFPTWGGGSSQIPKLL